MDVYNIITILMVLAAAFGYINHRFIRMPGSIGIMLLSLLASLLIIGLGNIIPDFFIQTNEVIKTVDFQSVVLKIMLSFLLFAAAVQIDSKKLRTEIKPILLFSTISVLISTLVVGVLFYFVTKWVGLSVNILYCLLFGALISPTDPMAVLGILKKAKISPSLETKISGESLLNDGAGVVLFITFYEIAQIGIENVSVWDITWLFMREAGGGLLLGWLLGYLGFWLIKTIDNYVVEIMITLAIVMGGYLLAEKLMVSGPLTMVIAGLITGNKSLNLVTSENSKDYIRKFWELIDALMNAILFLLIGLEMLIIPFNTTLLFLGFVAIAIVLLARNLSVRFPIWVLKKKRPFENNTIPILTWGALRGGISVALALSVPKYMYGEMFLSVTYIVVLFSIIVQGLSIGRLANRLRDNERPAS